MEMKQVFNFGKGEAKDYLITFAAAMVNGDKTVDNGVTGAETLSVVEKYIDNKTQHVTTAVYNYGKISSEKKMVPLLITLSTLLLSRLYSIASTTIHTLGDGLLRMTLV